MRSLSALVLVLSLTACGGDDSGGDDDTQNPDASVSDVDAALSSPDASTTPTADAAPIDATPALRPVRIVVVGDPTPPAQHTPPSQTPRDYTMGLSRLELMTAIDDPAPVLGFDLGAGIVVPMDSMTTVGTVDLDDVPPGTYTHVKVRVTQARFTVDATAHAMGFTDMGTITMTAALSDTVIDGTAHTKGFGHIDYMGLINQGQDVEIPAGAIQSQNGVTVVEDATATYLIFPMPEPLVVTADPANDPATGTITFKTGDSFTWEDLTLTDYASDQWDVSINQSDVEPVTGLGAREYTVVFE